MKKFQQWIEYNSGKFDIPQEWKPGGKCPWYTPEELFDRFCFSIESGKIAHNEASRLGSEWNGRLEEYNLAYSLADFAWQNQIYDEVVNNSSITPATRAGACST